MNIHDLIKWHSEQLDQNRRIVETLKKSAPDVDTTYGEILVKVHTDALKCLNALLPLVNKD